MSDLDVCACGHIEDEHDDEHACTVDDCYCFYYEYDPDQPGSTP